MRAQRSMYFMRESMARKWDSRAPEAETRESEAGLCGHSGH